MKAALFLTILPFTFCAAAENPPWRDRTLPADGKVVELASAGGMLWAGTAAGKLYRSRTGREDWSLALRRADAPVSGIVGFKSSVYAGFGTRVDLGLWDCFSFTCVSPATLGGLLRSGDGGATWTALPLKAVTALHVYGDTLYAATLTGLYVSRDGNAWTQLRSTGALDGKSEAVRALRRAGSELFLVGQGRTQRCSLQGDAVVPTGNGPLLPTGIAVIGKDVLINTESALYHTRAGSSQWDTTAAPRFSWIGEDSAAVLALPRDGVAAFYTGAPNGTTWTAHPMARWTPTFGLCRHPGGLFAIGQAVPLYWLLESDVGGLPYWVDGGSRIYDYPVVSLAARDGGIRVTKQGPGRSFRGVDGTAGWTPDTIAAGASIEQVASGGPRLFAASGGKWYVDKGAGWRIMADFSRPITGMTVASDWAAAYDDHSGALVVCSDLDAEPKCAESAPPIPLRDPGYAIITPILGTYVPPHAERLSAEGDLLVFARESVFVSPDRGATWLSRGKPPFLNPSVIKVHDGKLFAFGAATGGNTASPTVGVSTDTGRTWMRLGTGLPTVADAWTLAFRAGETFAATDAGVFRIREGSGTWEPLNSGLPFPGVRVLAVDGDRLLAGLEEGSLWEWTMPSIAIRTDPRGGRSATARSAARPGAFRDETGVWRRIDGRGLPAVSATGPGKSYTR